MSNNVHILNLAAYSTPTIQESKKDAWVEYGVDNNYYSFLIDRYTNSTTNNAIINNISRLIYGRGLSALDASKKPNEYAQMMALFNKDCVRKICMDRKMLGQFAIQVHYSKDHSKILKAYHIPTNLIRAEKCDEDGNIVGYYYSDDWTDVKKFKPQRYSAFGTSKDEVEILFSKPYAVGMKYYSYPDYQGSLPYAMLEEEIADYLINDVQRSFSGKVLLNFSNGIPTEEQQEQIASKITAKLTGAQGNPVIVAFNHNAESATTIESIPVDNAPEHYAFLSEECLRKIMLGHNVTSPLLFGIATSTGFSSNADELKNSSILFDNMVIRPMQEEILEAFDSILAYNGISLKLYFKTLQPLEFTDLENAQTEEQVAEETGTELSSIDPTSFSSDLDLEEWELIDSRMVDYEEEEENDNLINKANNPSLLTKVLHLASTGVAYPKRNSEQDTKLFRTRYRYSGGGAGEREFCQKMMAANKLYRKEDIIKMGEINVNPGFGMRPTPNEPYSIWLWKGGGLLSEEYPNGTCKHFWTRETYRRIGTDITSPLAKKVTPSEARKAGEILPTNDARIYKAPHDMK
jgi:hypothetical protein